MSKVSYSSLAAQEAVIRRLRRRETALSLSLSVALLAGLMFGLGKVLLPGLLRPQPAVLVVEASPSEEAAEPEAKPVRAMSQVPVPPPPSAAPVALVAAMKPAEVVIPVPEVELPDFSAELGSGDDFADGWGAELSEPVAEWMPEREGAAVFFEQPVRAHRVAYVIDFSRSMVGARERMMREEMERSVMGLEDGMGFQLILFAGPAWVAGHEVSMASDRRSAEVVDGERRFRWTQKGGGGNWEVRGRKPAVEWIQASRSTVRESLGKLRATPLVYGTCWEQPLEMALGMDPPPQVVFFMTDGARGGEVLEVVERLARKARRKGVTVHTVAMMEPKAGAAMSLLARETGGRFTMVRRGGVVEQPALD